jgi:hypothetical protein
MIQHKNLKAAKAAVKGIEAVSVYYRDPNGTLMIFGRNKHGEWIKSKESTYVRYLDQCI